MLFKKNVLSILALLLCLSLCACQGQTGESNITDAPSADSAMSTQSSSGEEDLSTPAASSEIGTETSSGEENPSTPSLPGYVFTGINNESIYLDRTGALMTGLPPASWVVTDNASGEPVYFQRSFGGITYLYSLDGRVLDSSSGIYGSCLAPYIVKTTADESFLEDVYIPGDLINPLDGTCLLKGIRGMFALDQDRVLLSDENFEICYVLHRNGEKREWNREAGLYINGYYSGLLCLRTPDNIHWFYNDKLELIRQISPEQGEGRFSGWLNASLGAYVVILSDQMIEFWDYQSGKSLLFHSDTQLWEREIDYYSDLGCNGKVIWGHNRLYDMQGDLLMEFTDLNHYGNPKMPFIAYKGSRIFVLDEDGTVLREREVPNMIEPGIHSLQRDSCCLPIHVRREGSFEECIILLNEELEPISDREFISAWGGQQGIIFLRYREDGFKDVKTMLMDDQGHIIMEDIRMTGRTLNGASDEYIAVAKGPYIGLIDRQGNWVRKNSIYDIPQSLFYDD